MPECDDEVGVASDAFSLRNHHNSSINLLGKASSEWKKCSREKNPGQCQDPEDCGMGRGHQRGRGEEGRGKLYCERRVEGGGQGRGENLEKVSAPKSQ